MKYCFTLVLSLGSLALFAQLTPFTSIAESDMFLPAQAEVQLPASHYRTVEIDVAALHDYLSGAPGATSRPSQSALTVRLPLPDGSQRNFRVIESGVMPPELQARWPQIRSYKLVDTDQPRYQGRMTVSPQGVFALFRSSAGEVFVDPYATAQNRYHAVYFNRDVVVESDDLPVLSCGYTPTESEVELTDEEAHFELPPSLMEFSKTLNDPAFVHQYTLALTCTGEYALLKGGTLESVMTSFVAAADRANLTFESELGVRMVLHPNTEDLIFLSPNLDPFVNSDEGRELLGQVENAIVNVGGVPANSFDLGHVFTGGCTDVGGVVSGQACTGGKTRGVTCHYSSSIDAIVRRVMVHEIAHQFGTAHSWDNCPPAMTPENNQRASGSAFEPGSGSTIMSYAGTCGSTNNVVSSGDEYYHGHSLDQFIYFSREGTASGCATLLATGNTEPVVHLPYENGFYIPMETPFELEAEASDLEGDPLTYCWEQMNLASNPSTLGSPAGNSPSFRSFPPTAASNRVFPRLQDLVNNTSNVNEVLPAYSRDLAFRCTVRDNNEEIGAAVWEDMSFKVTNTAGPFRVISPNHSTIAWNVGDYREVTWDVANTDNALVNCQRVNIRLSTDGGYTYPITLLTDAPNTGSAFVTVPDAVTGEARIRVEAANSIFFDISNNSFNILPAAAPTYTLNMGPLYQQLCLPATAEVTFNSGSILGYDSLVTLSVVSQLPEQTLAAFTEATILPGDQTTLQLDFTAVADYDGPLEVTVQAVAPSLDTFYRTVYFELVDNDFSDLTLLTPDNGQDGIGLSTDFAWTELPNAQLYDWQLATSPVFDESMVEDHYNLDTTGLRSSIFFEENTLFFWRVRAINECGPGEWQTPKAFHTVNAICAPNEAEDLPVNIPGTGPLPTVTSSLTVPFAGEISDVNIPYLNVSYQPIQNFRITLISPQGTEVVLYDGNCFGTDQVAIGFDDDAPSAITCPPDDGIVFRPHEPLSVLAGESSQGIWTLKVKVLESGFGAPGAISSWGLEFCATSTPQSPVLIASDTLRVPPGGINPITRELLEAEDEATGPDQLTYTVVPAPQHGELYFLEQPLAPGDQFRQSTINALNLRYGHLGDDATADQFTYVVEDGTGGFIPVQPFPIIIDENAVVSTRDIQAADAFRLYPNPATDWVKLSRQDAADVGETVQLFNLHGQLVREWRLQPGSTDLLFELGNQPAGLYFVRYGAHTERLVKQ
ncbi:MAG: proprotein convertase P-domain-containing protein [Lewinella sp.]|nr:proprotein convertase P-domain-containing protein [Lewinella sp.]